MSRLPQRIKDSDKLWAEGAEPINVVVYVLFHIKFKLLNILSRSEEDTGLPHAYLI